MEQTSTSVFNKTDWHHIISPDDYVDNASLPYDLFDDMYHIGIFGMSRCGKGNMIARLFQHYWLHKIDAQCIYIFSPTFNTDITFSSIRHYLRRELGEKYDDHVKNKPDLAVIKKIMEEQEKAM